MRTHRDLEVPAALLRLKQRFVAWRKKRVAGQRIPEPLWNSAAELAVKYGLSRTAGFLRLDYYSLRKRAEGASRLANPSAFVELPPAALSIMSECVKMLAPTKEFLPIVRIGQIPNEENQQRWLVEQL